MSQTIKISAGFSDKVSENYNSQQFSVNLEMECSINGKTVEVEAAADKLFALCRKIVDRQKGVTPSTESLPLAQPPKEEPSNQMESFASDKQIKCIFGMAKAQGRDSQAIKALISTRFGKRVENISKAEASAMINELKQAA